MDIAKDYEELFKVLNKYKAKYLVVGAYAVVYYGEPRFTKDIDIWISNNEANAVKVYKALKEFGAPLLDINASDFTKDNLIYQIGVAPVRVDIMMSLPGSKFSTAWNRRKRTKYGATPINLIGLSELIKSKKIAGRKQDKLDLEMLAFNLKKKR